MEDVGVWESGGCKKSFVHSGRSRKFMPGVNCVLSFSLKSVSSLIVRILASQYLKLPFGCSHINFIVYDSV